ncbi:DUF6266 family protein [Pedobacter sp. UYP24]
MYNPEKAKFVTFKDFTNREVGEVNLNLPNSFAGNTVHCWMQYVDQTGTAVSTTAYLGEVVV